MNQKPLFHLVKYNGNGDQDPSVKSESTMNSLTLFLAYLAYLKAIRPSPPPEVSALRLLIVVTGLLLIVIALVAAGAADQIGSALTNWPIMP